MLKQIIAEPVWFWFFIGGLFLIAELLSSSGYLLWIGIAAIFTSFIIWLIPEISWNLQGILFSIMIIFSVLSWRKWFCISSKSLISDPNKKQHQFIGMKAYLISDTNNGYSRIRLMDGSWRIYCSEQLSANAEVEVIDIEGITLTVKPVRAIQQNSQSSR
ncbi:MAG: NfeD family protein [Candidatus Arsenophonus melophagi]|nr:NfeD family protein [Candidatus Arsenophonus melophagi]